MASPVVILSWTLAGRTWRMGTRACQPVASSGALQVLGGLPTSDVDESIEIASSELSASWNTDIIAPLDMAQIIDSHSHVPEGEAGEVSVWTPGDAWEQRQVILSGRVSSLTWGPAGRHVRLTVDGDPSSLSGEWPPSDAVVDDDTWTAPQDNTTDQPYPWIVGRPGVYWSRGSTRNVSGSPAYIIAGTAADANKYLLIAGHLTDTRADTRWRIRDDTQDVEDAYTSSGGVLEYDDGLGRRCTILNITSTVPNRAGAVDLAYADGDDLYVQWTGSGGQVWDGDTLEAAGDVLAWALRLSGLPVDWARCGAARGVLPWKLAGYWDERCSVRDWIRDQLQPILPVSLRVGRDGVYPVVWPWWADSSWAVDHLVQGQSITLDPTIKREQATLASGVQVRFARSASTGEYKESIQIQAETPTGRGYTRTLEARSAQPWTPGEPKVVDADLVWCPTTAGMIAGWLGQYHMRTRTAYRVTGRESRLTNIHLGDIVLLSLTDPPITRRRGMVRRRTHRGSSITLEIVTW